MISRLRRRSSKIDMLIAVPGRLTDHLSVMSLGRQCSPMVRNPEKTSYSMTEAISNDQLSVWEGHGYLIASTAWQQSIVQRENVQVLDLRDGQNR
jgi:hypothetical protein